MWWVSHREVSNNLWQWIIEWVTLSSLKSPSKLDKKNQPGSHFGTSSYTNNGSNISHGFTYSYFVIKIKNVSYFIFQTFHPTWNPPPVNRNSHKTQFYDIANGFNSCFTGLTLKKFLHTYSDNLKCNIEILCRWFYCRISSSN